MIQQPLFQNFESAPRPSKAEIESAREKRFKLADKAAKKAGEAFQNAFREYFLIYLKNCGKGTTEEIRSLYKKSKLPQPHKWKAAGSVVSELSRKGIIKTVDYVKSPTRRAPIPVFTLVTKG
jgi:chaperonin GroEL (HSP60 family)